MGSLQKLSIQLDLQFFGDRNFDKNQVLEKIKNGEIDGDKFNQCYNYFKECFKDGIETPLGKVEDIGDRYYHIANRHVEMIEIGQVDRIVSVL